MPPVKSHLHCLPGIALSFAVALAAIGIAHIESAFLGYPWLDAVVLAIIGGTLLQTFIGFGSRWAPGIRISSKLLLEIAIVLLGASVSLATIRSTGGAVALVVAGLVVTSILMSYSLGRLLGLSDRLAMLVACGNSICGNSAIVAAAPVIDAGSEDVAASIAFTAALGVLVVLALPLAFALFGMSQWQYGVMAGLTVYAVPQVLAATVPVGAVSTQVGTIVKLLRVLMLGPVILMLGLREGGRREIRPPLHQMAPWFISGFLAMAAARSLDLIPQIAVNGFEQTSSALTIISMAALGLSVNLRTVLASGGRVLAAGSLSILALAILSALALAFLPTPALFAQ